MTCIAGAVDEEGVGLSTLCWHNFEHKSEGKKSNNDNNYRDGIIIILAFYHFHMLQGLFSSIAHLTVVC